MKRPPPKAVPARARPSWDADTVLVGACALAIAFLLGQIILFDYGRDQGIYAMVARSILNGGMPYRDAWDFKPPGIFVIYAAARAFFGASQRGIRIVEAAGLVGMTWAMIRIARDQWGSARTGWIAGAIAILVHAELEFWHTAQPESFGGMATIFALMLIAPCLDDPLSNTRAAWLRILGAGALFGFAGLLKPPLAGGGAVVAFALAWRARARGGDLGSTLRPAAIIALGGALPLILCVAWFAAKGALGDLHAVLLVFTPHYTALSWRGETLAPMAYFGFSEWLLSYCSVPTAGLFLLLAFRPTPREAPMVKVLAGIVAIELVGVVMQGKFFPYHFGATWPPTALLAAIGFERAYQRFSTRGPLGAGVFVGAVAALALLHSATKTLPETFRARAFERVSLVLSRSRNQDAFDRLATVADVNALANRRVAELLAAEVPHDRSVYVWGFEPVIYDLADREPATRYLYDVPQRVAWAKADARAVLMRDLEAHKPKAIVVEHGDVFSFVTGNNTDSADTLNEFPELAEFIATGYALRTSIEDFDVYFESR